MELEHDPVSAPLIQEAVRRVIEGASVGSIAKDFNARGILSPRDHSAMRDTGEPRKDKETGKPLPPQKWTDETLRRMLTNEVLLGRLISNGKVERDDEGKPVMRGEPLISEEDWGALQDAITGAKKPKTRKAPDALLSGVAFCAFCGEVLHFHWAVKPTRGQEYRYYRCSGRAKKNNGCKSDAVRAEALDALVIETVLSMVGDFDIMKKVYIPGDDSAAELADVENRMQDFRDDRAAGLYKGERGTAEFREMYAKLEERREQLEGRDSKPGGWEYISTGVTYRQRWESGDTTERRKTLLDSELRVYATATQNEPLTAVDEYWAKLEAEEGSRAMVAYVPEDAGGFHLVLIWTGNLAERLTGKREATGHPKLTKQGITVKGGLQETAGP
jgi:site-specific DNA recombinase